MSSIAICLLLGRAQLYTRDLTILEVVADAAAHTYIVMSFQWLLYK
jgi:hypothetical protein